MCLENFSCHVLRLVGRFSSHSRPRTAVGSAPSQPVRLLALRTQGHTPKPCGPASLSTHGGVRLLSSCGGVATAAVLWLAHAPCAPALTLEVLPWCRVGGRPPLMGALQPCVPGAAGALAVALDTWSHSRPRGGLSGLCTGPQEGAGGVLWSCREGRSAGCCPADALAQWGVRNSGSEEVRVSTGQRLPLPEIPAHSE